MVIDTKKYFFYTHNMFLIVGLGNPTNEYKGTRHNAGFEVIDLLSQRHNIPVTKAEHKGLLGKGLINGQKVILCKPLTYMNASGECVNRICNYYGIDPSTELLVISDDVTLDCGSIRIRAKGSAGGHNGLKDIIAWCDTQSFARIRVGVGILPKGKDMVSHVLGHFNNADSIAMKDGYTKAADAVPYILDGHIDKAQNLFN